MYFMFVKFAWDWIVGSLLVEYADKYKDHISPVSLEAKLNPQLKLYK